MCFHTEKARFFAIAIIAGALATACPPLLNRPVAAEQDSPITVPSVEALRSYKQGVAHLGKKEYKLAIEAFTKAIDLYPKYVEAYELRADAYEHRGARWKALSDRDKVADIRVEQELAEAMQHYSRVSSAEGFFSLIGVVLVIWIWKVRRLSAQSFLLVFISAALLAVVVNMPFRFSIGVLAMFLASIMIPADEKPHVEKPFEDHPLEIALTNQKANDDK